MIYKHRTHFVRTTAETKAICGTSVNDSMPLIFWDLRLWNSPYGLVGRCCRCLAALSKEPAHV